MEIKKNFHHFCRAIFEANNNFFWRVRVKANNEDTATNSIHFHSTSESKHLSKRSRRSYIVHSLQRNMVCRPIAVSHDNLFF